MIISYTLRCFQFFEICYHDQIYNYKCGMSHVNATLNIHTLHSFCWHVHMYDYGNKLCLYCLYCYIEGAKLKHKSGIESKTTISYLARTCHFGHENWLPIGGKLCSETWWKLLPRWQFYQINKCYRQCGKKHMLTIDGIWPTCGAGSEFPF